MTNVIRQGSKTLPTLDEQNPVAKSNNRSIAHTDSTVDKKLIVNIDALNPYMNKFVYISHHVFSYHHLILKNGC